MCASKWWLVGTCYFMPAPWAHYRTFTKSHVIWLRMNGKILWPRACKHGVAALIQSSLPSPIAVAVCLVSIVTMTSISDSNCCLWSYTYYVLKQAIPWCRLEAIHYSVIWSLQQWGRGKLSVGLVLYKPCEVISDYLWLFVNEWNHGFIS